MDLSVLVENVLFVRAIGNFDHLISTLKGKDGSALPLTDVNILPELNAAGGFIVFSSKGRSD